MCQVESSPMSWNSWGFILTLRVALNVSVASLGWHKWKESSCFYVWVKGNANMLLPKMYYLFLIKAVGLFCVQHFKISIGTHVAEWNTLTVEKWLTLSKGDRQRNTSPAACLMFLHFRRVQTGSAGVLWMTKYLFLIGRCLVNSDVVWLTAVT